MLSIEDQIYGVSLIWSEAKYNFAFWNTRKNIDWDTAYQKTLNNVMKPMKLLDYYLELMRFISLLNDGHTYVEFPEELRKGFMSLPLKIRNHNGKHIITNVEAGCPIPIFSEILEINGMNFDEYMKERILPYCWNIKSTSTYELLYTFYWLDGDVDKNAYAFIPIVENNKNIELLTSNGLFTVKPVSRNIDWSYSSTLKSAEKLTETFTSNGFNICYTYDDIAILTLPTFMDDEMPTNFYSKLSELNKCKGFVIDIRNNSGGHSQNADAFSQAFIKGEFQSGKVKHSVHIGAYKAWGNGADLSNWDLSDAWAKKVYDVCNHNLFEEEISTAFYPDCPLTLNQPIVILENAATGSSSENLLMNFDHNKRATIVGVPSYGTTGNPLFVKLPGEGRARICTRRYTYPNDKEFINIGIEPHVYVDLTLDDLLARRDRILDEGLNVLRSQLI